MNLTVFHKLTADKAIACLLSGGDLNVHMSEIIEFAELSAVTDDVLKEYLISRLADDDNVLAKVLGSGKPVGEGLRAAAVADLELLLGAVKNTDFNYISGGVPAYYCEQYTASVKAMCSADSAEKLFSLLCDHYRTLGTGIYAKHIAFLCDKEGIYGIESPDETSFDSLIGLEHIKKVLRDNAELFLSGERANNVLLFGDRGTGKSSCVKALLNEYAAKGLRVIELPKNCITLIPKLFKELSDRPQKFILYLDDLSFEKHEPEYRSLKVSMEGQLGSIPQNVLIFATSNRRHLIKENWKDREGGDVHAGDNMQEMLSLSERFGISLVFAAPNQREYLDIVAKLLERRGIEMNAEIEKQAIVWQMNYGGRTPRCAAQFAAAYREN